MDPSEDPTTSLLMRMCRSFLVGAACLGVSLTCTLALYSAMGKRPVATIFARIVEGDPTTFNWVVSAFLTPVSETLVFACLWGLSRLLFKRSLIRRKFCFVSAMVVLGFLLHGGTPDAVGRALAFGVLAGLFAYVAQRSGWRAGFAETAAAHIIWNVSGLALLAAL